jgi:ATP-dependent RNA/DNA helicase IGHMBP2
MIDSHTQISEYFKNQLIAVQAEMDEEKRTFEGFLKTQNPTQRTKTGLTRFPLTCSDHGFLSSNLYFFDLQAQKPGQIFPQPENGTGFSGNKPVRLFNATEDVWIYGVIKHVKESGMRIIAPISDPPEELFQEPLGLDLRYDQRAYEDMKNALEIVEKARNCKLADLRDLILGLQKAPNLTTIPQNTAPILNEEQNLALQNILNTDYLFTLHGPPGTGKTTTLVQTIKSLVNNNFKILVCTASNAALDHITASLLAEKLNPLRLGNPARVDEKSEEATLDARIKNHTYYKDVPKLLKQAAEYFRKAETFKRSFGPQERLQRKEYRETAREYLKEADQILFHIEQNCLENTLIHCATLSGSAAASLKKIQYDYLIVDEASQALEPAIWLALLKADRLILAGDPKQLPPTTKSTLAEKVFHPVLMEKCMQKYPQFTEMLRVQYRMHENIMAFPSKHFYENKLIAHTNCKSEHKHPFTFIDTAGSGWEESTDASNGSIQNLGEATFTAKIAQKLKEQFPHQNIAVITPYRAQVKALLELECKANTIDSFQGQEADIIILSLVRSNPSGECGFLKDERRLNVALTRAKQKLIVVGDSATVANLPVYTALIQHAENSQSYDSVWSYPELI